MSKTKADTAQEEEARPKDYPGFAHRLTLKIPLQTPSNNEIKEMHHFVYKSLRQKWKKLLWVAAGGRGRTPIGKSWIVIERYCAGGLDWDNVYGGLKPVLDCLVVPTKRNPDGLSFVENDNPQSMPFPPLVVQRPAPRGEGKTIIHIYEILNEQNPYPQHVFAPGKNYEGDVAI